MPFDVKLPDIGEGIAEGEIVRWLVHAGEAVREDQPLVEVMTDKATVEIPSPRNGTIAALHAAEGQVVPVGSVIVSIALAGDEEGAAAAEGPRGGSALGGTEGADHAPPPRVDPAATAATRATTGARPSAPSGRVQATPAVRQMAKLLGVTLEHLSGSGPGGVITAQDVERVAGASTAKPSGRPAATLRDLAASPPATAGPEERVPVRGLRRLIGEHMRRSLDTAAHFTFVAECDLTELVEHRAALKARAEKTGVKLTYLAYVIRALIDSLRRYPLLNASLDDERQEIVIRRYYHVGIATHTPEGLTVPVLRDADRRPLFALAREIERLAAAARAGKLKLEELQGGTFTVTSTGARGGLLATPILHHPQVAILGVHEVKKKPAVVEDKIVARDLGHLSLSLDHRVVDGAVGADFLYDLIGRLEKPAGWLDEGAIE